MRAALIHLDEALIGQPHLMARVAESGGVRLDLRGLGPALRLWSRQPALARLCEGLRDALPIGDGPTLAFCGSGDFHHVTPLLLQRAIEASGCAEVTLLHFDNHPDWVRFANGAHCGSWVGWAARLKGVAKVVTVGVCSADINKPSARRADLDLLSEARLELYAYADPGGGPSVALGGHNWPTIEAMGEAAFAEFLPGRIPTKAIYVTVDKDVLRAADAATNWDQGRTSLDLLKILLGRILEGHTLIGADVVGDWSAPQYGGGLAAQVLKQGEALLDQPWARPSPEARAANEGVNLELLDLFAKTAA
jgi:hypothetical protein